MQKKTEGRRERQAEGTEEKKAKEREQQKENTTFHEIPFAIISNNLSGLFIDFCFASHIHTY